MDPLDPRRMRRLKRAARRHPDAALRLAALLGAALGPGSSAAPGAEVIAAVLGARTPRQVRRLQRRIAANCLRDVLAVGLVQRLGLAPLARRTRVVGAERLLGLRARGIPVAVVAAHVGVRRGVSAALERLAVPARVATRHAVPRVPGCVRYQPVTDPAAAARFLRAALEDLDAQGVPVLAFDGAADGGVPATFLGRQVEVGRGLPLLAARGARLVPVTTRWRGLSPHVEATVHPPLPALEAADSTDATRAFAQGVAAWFEDHVRRHPGDLRLAVWHDLAAAKPA